MKSAEHNNEDVISSFSGFYAVFSVVATILVLLTNWVIVLGLGSLVVFTFFLWRYRHSQILGGDQFSFGFANWITLSRFLGSCFLGIYFYNTQLTARLSVFLASSFITLVVFDKVDGVVARILKETSTLGAYLDVEVDGFTTLICSILLYNHGIVGIWIIGLGLLRYIYILIIFISSFLVVLTPLDEKSGLGALIGLLFSLSLALGFLVEVPLLLTWIDPFLIWSIRILSGFVILSFIRSFLLRFR